MSRDDELRIRLTAKDDASSTIDKVADKVEGLERDDVAIALTASDKASKTIADVETRLAALSDEDKAIVLRAQGKEFSKAIAAARRELREFQDLSDDEIALRVRVIEENTKALDQVQAKVRELDGETVTIRADARGFDRLGDTLDNLPGNIGAALGPMRTLATGAGGVASGIGAAAVATKLVADYAADAALGAQQLATLTGTTVEEASRLSALWQMTGADVKDLQDVILQMSGVIADQPELLAQVGAQIARNRDGSVDLLQTFENVVEATRNLPSNMENAALKSRLFGEEGVRQVNALTSRFEDLDDALRGLPDGLVVSDDDVATAKAYQANLAEITAQAQAFGVTLGQTVLPMLQQATGLLAQLGPAIGLLGTGLGSLSGDLPGFDRLSALDVAPILGTAESLSKVFGEGVDNVDRMKAGVTALAPPLKLIPGGFFDVKTEAEKAEEKAAKLRETVEQVQQGFDPLGREAAGFVDSMTEAELATAKTEANTRRAAEQTEREAAAIEAARIDAEAYATAQERATTALLDRQGAILGEPAARTRLAEAQRRQNEGEKKGNLTLDERAQLAIDVAEAYADVVEITAKSNGETFTATQRNRALEASVRSIASTAKRDLGGALTEVADRLEEIPREVHIEFEGRTASAISSLNAFERDAENRRVFVPVDANTNPAENELDAMIRYYERRGLALPARVFFGGEGVAPSSGGQRPRSVGGTAVAASSVTIVNLPPGASGRDVIAAQRRHARRNGGY